MPASTNVYAQTFTVDAGSPHVVGSYGYCAGSYPNSLVLHAWTLAGSNNNSTWYLMDTVSNGNGGGGDARWFYPSGPNASVAFRYYRWCLQSAGSSGNSYIGGFFFNDSSNNLIYCSLIQNNIRAQYHGGGLMTVGNMLNHQSFQYGNEDWLPDYQSNWYYGGNYTTVITDPPDGPPNAPTSLGAHPENNGLSISFTAGSINGSAISNYKYSIDGGSTYTAFNPPQTTSPVFIGNLTNGQSYNIKILAVNGLGDGTPSALITGTPSTVPDAPIDLVASYGGSGAVTISFTPGYNGGAAITNYQYSIDGGSTFTPLTPADGISPITITGLTNGMYYVIELKALNIDGPSNGSSSIGYTASGLPDAPTNITWVDTYNGSIHVSFTAGFDQGSSIVNYKYSLDGGATFTTLNPEEPLGPITITGLTNRTHYSLVLQAINANGAGASSTPLAMYYMCFLEGTKITCYDATTQQEVERSIETLRKGDLVKTTMDGYKAIDTIGTSKIYNPGNSMRSKHRLYRCSKENYPELKEDLVITGCHAVLVSELTDEQRRELIDIQGKVYVTEDYYRLIACVDKRAVPYEKEGLFNIWHFALENDNYYFNYGVFANGLKVETASKRMMKEMSGMTLM